jgi:ribosomal protein S12 methylthiotransferase accessory factor
VLRREGMTEGLPVSMTISFPGGAAVDARFRGHTIHTDQPLAAGGEDSGSSPFDLFLASIGTCMGFYALRFCQQRGLATEGLSIDVRFEREPDGKRVANVRAEVALPEAFPAKYHDAILRAMDQCAVKKALAAPPEFDIALVGVDAAVMQEAAAPN